MKKKYFYLITIAFVFCLSTFAQNKASYTKKSPAGFVRCRTVESEASLRKIDPTRETDLEFENWISKKIAEMTVNQKQSSAQSPVVVITIPVVVHIISNGDAIGTNENISDARVFSQITVLNQDFRKMLGTPGYNTNAVGADMEINFVLAQRKPDNVTPTNGIDRVTTTNGTYNVYADSQAMKAATQWDPTKYFNIWTVYFTDDEANYGSSNPNGMYGTLGYAQFPSSSGLTGVATNAGSANTDGLVCDYRCFGTSSIVAGGYFNGYDKGRTSSHEIGHCFGLRHIWGDGNGDELLGVTDCNATDYCADTPQAGYEHYSCGTFDTCPTAVGVDMVQNYMDYTPDTCMNIFTINQKSRMQAVLANSPRRNTLANSNAATPLNISGYNLQAVSIYPNPANDNINIIAQDPLDSIVIYNAIGQLVSKTMSPIQSQTQVNITDLPNGVYFVQIKKDSSERTIKFIKN